MKKSILILTRTAAAVAALFIVMGANCITSGNILVVVDIDNFDAQTDTEFETRRVDLSENEDWKEHKEDINSIDDLGFAVRITNNADVPAAGQLYVWSNPKGATTTVDEVRANAILVLDGIVVEPGKTREIEWGESKSFVKNFVEAKKVIFGEEFYVYFFAAETPFSITVQDLVLIMSVNGKP